MYKALHLSPMIPSFAIDKTVHFFTDLLGFQIMRDEANYVIVQKDNLSLHILKAGPDVGQMEFYLEVDDVNAIWKSIENKVKHLRVKAPFDREYGMREVHIDIPETNALLFIGQVSKK